MVKDRYAFRTPLFENVLPGGADMRDKEFLSIQSALRTAVCEPEAAPPSLVMRTARRCEAVLAGRWAENRLRHGEDLPAEEVYSLAAASVLGKLALGGKMPDGQSVSEMGQKISTSEWFRRQFSGTAADALNRLHSGVVLRGNAEASNGIEHKIQKDKPVRQQAPK